jgi:hypothetical protein
MADWSAVMADNDSTTAHQNTRSPIRTLPAQSRGTTSTLVAVLLATRLSRDYFKTASILLISSLYLTFVLLTNVGRDSSIGITTRYGLNGERIESRWGQDFLHLFRPALGPTQPPIQWVPEFFPWGKRPERKTKSH